MRPNSSEGWATSSRPAAANGRAVAHIPAASGSVTQRADSVRNTATRSRTFTAPDELAGLTYTGGVLDRHAELRGDQDRWLLWGGQDGFSSRWYATFTSSGTRTTSTSRAGSWRTTSRRNSSTWRPGSANRTRSTCRASPWMRLGLSSATSCLAWAVLSIPTISRSCRRASSLRWWTVIPDGIGVADRAQNSRRPVHVGVLSPAGPDEDGGQVQCGLIGDSELVVSKRDRQG